MCMRFPLSLESDDLWCSALAFATQAHGTQTRRGSGMPYVVHPEEASQIVHALGGSKDEVLAALFHDVLEDTAVTRDELSAMWGDSVISIVCEVTDPKEFGAMPRPERKAAQARKMETASASARLIKMVDQMLNIRDIRLTLEFWKSQAALEYAEGGMLVARSCHTGDQRMLMTSIVDEVSALRAAVFARDAALSPFDPV